MDLFLDCNDWQRILSYFWQWLIKNPFFNLVLGRKGILICVSSLHFPKYRIQAKYQADTSKLTVVIGQTSQGETWHHLEFAFGKSVCRYSPLHGMTKTFHAPRNSMMSPSNHSKPIGFTTPTISFSLMQYQIGFKRKLGFYGLLS